MLAIAMPDAVLVAPKQRAQDVKKAVELLKSKDIVQAEVFPKDHRPWGWFESLALGDRFQAKRICVKPGAALSLQSHQHRSEHWIVVEGTAESLLKKRLILLVRTINLRTVRCEAPYGKSWTMSDMVDRGSNW